MSDRIIISRERKMEDGRTLRVDRAFMSDEADLCNVSLDGLLAFYYNYLGAQLDAAPVAAPPDAGKEKP
jgi:hypothetical protein